MKDRIRFPLLGAPALAAAFSESPATLRALLTSKGGIIYAAISAIQTGNVAEAFIFAMHAANRRAGDGRGVWRRLRDEKGRF